MGSVFIFKISDFNTHAASTDVSLPLVDALAPFIRLSIDELSVHSRPFMRSVSLCICVIYKQ